MLTRVTEFKNKKYTILHITKQLQHTY